MNDNKKNTQWFAIPNQAGADFPEWMRSAGIDGDGTVWVSAAIAENERAVVLCALHDGEPMQLVDDHAFVRSSWMRREYKDTSEVLDTIERRTSEALKNDSEATEQSLTEATMQESKPDYAVEQAEIEQLAMQVAEAVYQAVKSRLSAGDSAAPTERITEHDDIETWIEECCVVANGAMSQSLELFQSFRQWKHDNSAGVESHKSFSMRLARKFSKGKSSGFMVFKGLQLKRDFVASNLPSPSKEKPALDSLKGWYFVTADQDQLIHNQGFIKAELPNDKYIVDRFSWITGESTGKFTVDLETIQTYFTLTAKTSQEHNDFCCDEYHRDTGKKLSTPPYEIGKGPLLEAERPES